MNFKKFLNQKINKKRKEINGENKEFFQNTVSAFFGEKAESAQMEQSNANRAVFDKEGNLIPADVGNVNNAEQTSEIASQPATFKYRKIRLITSLAVACCCLAVIIPVVLSTLNNAKNPDASGEDAVSKGVEVITLAEYKSKNEAYSIDFSSIVISDGSSSKNTNNSDATSGKNDYDSLSPVPSNGWFSVNYGLSDISVATDSEEEPIYLIYTYKLENSVTAVISYFYGTEQESAEYLTFPESLPTTTIINELSVNYLAQATGDTFNATAKIVSQDVVLKITYKQENYSNEETSEQNFLSFLREHVTPTP